MFHELTITLLPHLYSMTVKQQFELMAPYVKQILQGWSHTTIAELTLDENVHFHSIVQLDDKSQAGAEADRSKLIDRIRPFKKRYIGRTRCVPVWFEESWKTYITEDIKKTQRLITNPVVQDDFQLVYKPLPFEVYEEPEEFDNDLQKIIDGNREYQEYHNPEDYY